MWRWILAPLVALSLAANSPGKVFDNRDPAQPAVSAVLPLAPAAFSTPLPAGIRPEPRGGGGASETVAVDPPLAAPVFERFEISSGGGAALRTGSRWSTPWTPSSTSGCEASSRSTALRSAT